MSRPPKAARFILKILSSRKNESYSGDVEEEFHDRMETLGRPRARRWYRREVMRAVPRLISESIRWRGAMLKNIVKITMRNLQRHRLHSIINISGLIVGLTVVMLMTLYIRYELSFDRFHVNAAHVRRIIAHDMGRDIHFSAVQALAGPTFKQEFPEVLGAVRIRRFSGYLQHEEQRISESRIHFVDPDFLKIFTFPLASGDPGALEQPFSLFISREMARKYFEGENPVGRTLLLDNRHEFTIRGVLEKIPENSSLRFDMLASMSSLKTLWGEKNLNRWISHDFHTYVMLARGVDAARFEEKLNRFVSPIYRGKESQPAFQDRDVYYSQSLDRMHFRAGLRFDYILTTDEQTLNLMGVVSLVILLLSVFNYTTLATARATRRAREIGLRKVVGARRPGLVHQFLGESILAAFIALGISLGLVQLVLPAFSRHMSRSLTLNPISDLPGFLGLTLMVGIAAGVYPAFHLSSFRPSRVIRGTPMTGANSSALLRRTLVVAQFIITIGLLACLLIIDQQVRFMLRNSVKGFDDPILTVRLTDPDIRKRHEPLHQAFRQVGGVLKSTASAHHPLRVTGGTGIRWNGEEKSHFSRFTRVDHHYFDFYGIEFERGRGFSPDHAMDRTEAVIVNRTAAAESPWEDPIGKRCRIEGEGTVIGVVEDFHYRPLHIRVEPLTIRYITADSFLGGATQISLQLDSSDIPGTLAALEKTWQRFSPSYPFESVFLDETIDGIYRAEQRLSRSLSVFAAIAVFLAVLGLFGLTSFTAERRTREIGIRKTLGASSRGIFFMLTKDILIWVGLAVAAAFPAAYFSMHGWLQKFAYRIAIGPIPFLGATAASLLIAMLAISLQSIKAAVADPVASLRHE